MKKLASISLFFALLFPFVGTYFILQIQKQAVRKEIKWKIANGVDESELTYFKFHKDQVDSLVQWKHSKEFQFEGEMYDIVSSKTEGDTLHYWCWWDHEETQLNKMLDNLVLVAMQTDQKSNDKNHHFLKFLKSLALPNDVDYQNLVVIKDSSEFLYSSHFLPLKTAPLTPPPQLSFI